LAFVGASTLSVLVSNVTFGAIAGSDPTQLAENLWNIPSRVLEFGLVSS